MLHQSVNTLGSRSSFMDSSARGRKLSKLSFFRDNFPSEKLEEYFSRLSRSRRGVVLNQYMILKTDVIPSYNDISDSVGFLGITSFKAFDPWNVYCCSQPDESSIYSVINMLRTQGSDALDIIWMNLREEPSLYINGKSFVLRKKGDPYSNLFNKESVITKSKVENLEKRLKKDVVNEVNNINNSGNIVISDEVALRELAKNVLHVDSSTLLTTREMFYLVNIKGYNVKYYRIPIIETHPPSLEALSEIVDILLRNSSSKSIVFSDMSGHNKSVYCASVALVVRKWKALLHNFRDQNSSKTRMVTPLGDSEEDYLSLNNIPILSYPGSPAIPSDVVDVDDMINTEMDGDIAMTPRTYMRSAHDVNDVDMKETVQIDQRRLKRTGSITSKTLPTESDNIQTFYDSLLLNGNFAVIMNLVNMYPQGLKIKAMIDGVIKYQSSYYNILEHIVNIRNSVVLSSNKMEKQAWQEIAIKLLRKYFLLIAIGIYLHSTQSDVEIESFAVWMKKSSTIRDLFDSINMTHIDQYLSVKFGDDSISGLFSDLPVGMKGYLNVHTLLLLQQVTDQENNIIADHLLLSANQRQPVYGSVFTRTLDLSMILQSWTVLPQSLPKHLYIINIHRSPSVVIDHVLYCLRDRVSPLMTSPTYANYENHGNTLNQIEKTIVQELREFDKKYFVLFGYNQQNHMIDNYKLLINKDDLFTSKEGLSNCFRESIIKSNGTDATKNIQIHYSRISSNHYAIPSYSGIDQFISVIQNVPESSQNASTIVIFAHNLSGLLFHLPLISLIYSHIRPEYDEMSDDGSIFENGNDLPSNSELTFSHIMCLNVITDLCRLLSRGYSHLYTVFSIIHSSVKQRITSTDKDGMTTYMNDQFNADTMNDINSDDNLPMSLFEYISQQYRLYTSHVALESESSNTFYYLRYLQGLQKMVYLMIIDDYLTSSYVSANSTSFVQWINARPEIVSILDSLNNPNTKVVMTPSNITQDTELSYSETPLTNEEILSEDERDTPQPIQEDEDGQTRFVYKHINGLVLNMNSVIKDDYFPGSRNVHLVPQLDGAPNFRVSEFTNRVFGVGIPMINGIVNTVDYIGKNYGANNITWVNLREEPIIFLNGKPYSLRNITDMINNLIFTGIDSERVIEIERKFKQDILQEAMTNRSMIMVNDENEKSQSVMHLIPITESSVITLEEVYRRINKNSKDVQISLFRVPITDEQAPLSTTIDHLIAIVMRNYMDYFVFNCQIGRGRTTTGMIICSMALSFKRGDWHTLLSHISKKSTDEQSDVSEQLNESGLVVLENYQKSLLDGYYACVSELIGMMKSGSKAKRKLDYIIDLSSDMQNIREVIYHYHSVSMSSQTPQKKREESMDRAIHFLHRYCVLLILAEYFEEHLPDENNPIFSVWLSNHEEFSAILCNISLE